jgi:hypothetical protein
MRFRLAAFYLATPLFLLLEPVGLPLRAAFLPGTEARIAYYALCFAGGLLAWRIPATEPWVAGGESAVAMTFLIVGFLSPLYDPDAWIVAGATSPFTTPVILNFALSAAVLWLAFQNAIAAISSHALGASREAAAAPAPRPRSRQ